MVTPLGIPWDIAALSASMRYSKFTDAEGSKVEAIRTSARDADAHVVARCHGNFDVVMISIWVINSDMV